MGTTVERSLPGVPDRIRHYKESSATNIEASPPSFSRAREGASQLVTSAAVTATIVNATYENVSGAAAAGMVALPFVIGNAVNATAHANDRLGRGRTEAKRAFDDQTHTVAARRRDQTPGPRGSAALQFEEQVLRERGTEVTEAEENAAAAAAHAAGQVGYAVAVTATTATMVANMAHVAPAVTGAMGLVSVAAGIPAQAVSTIADAIELFKDGKLAHRQVRSLHDLKDLPFRDESTRRAAAEALNRHREYTGINMAATALDAAGQILLISGGVCVFCGPALAPAAKALTVTGIVTAVTAGALKLGNRWHQQQFEGRRTGVSSQAASPYKNLADDLAEHGIEFVTNRLANDQAANTDLHADLKLMSLTLEALKKEKPARDDQIDELSAARLRRLGRMAETSIKGPLRRTTLLKGERALVNEKFNELSASGFYLGRTDDVRKRVMDRLLQNESIASLAQRERSLSDIQARTIRSLQKSDDKDVVDTTHRPRGKAFHDVSDSDYVALLDRNEGARKTAAEQTIRYLTQTRKNDTARARADINRQFMTLAATQHAMQNMTQEQRLRRASSAEELSSLGGVSDTHNSEADSGNVVSTLF